MHRLGVIPLVGVALCSALDLGNLDQYKSRDKAVPELTGSTLWVSGQEGEGFDVALSADLQASVQVQLDSKCQNPDDGCYQAIRNTIREAGVQLDGGVDKRDLAALLSKTFKKFGGLFTEISVILYAMWKMKNPGQPHLDLADHYIPQDQANAVASLGTEPVEVSAAGSVIVTITPTPDPTSASMGQTAALTAISTPTGSYVPGDVVISMDRELAGRISDIMGMMTNCAEGNSFASSKKIRSTGMGAAICGSVGAMQQMAPGGPLLPLRQFAVPDRPPLQFNGRDIVRAAGIVLQIGRDLAPALEIPPELMDQLAMVVFALAVEKFIDNVDLGDSNWIHGSSLATETMTSTAASSSASSSCSTRETSSCLATCTERGIIEACETNCETQTAEGCAALTETAESNEIVTVTTLLWTWEIINAPMPEPTAEPSATATSIDCSKVTGVPGKCGTPGCAYVIASNLGPAALCPNDYCNCGGHVGPLLTATVDGKTSKNCAYSTVPTCGDCNAATCTASPTPEKPSPTAAWFPAPSARWVAMGYVYDKDHKWYSYYYYAGEKGQSLDPCGKTGFTGSIKAFTEPLVDPADYDNIPFPPTLSFSNQPAPFNECKYNHDDKGPGNLVCGDLTIQCQKQKPDPVTQTCKPGDGGGWSTLNTVMTIVVQCVWPS